MALCWNGPPCPHPVLHVQALAYVVNELLDHAIPLALVVLGPVLAIFHQPDLVREAQDVRQLLEQVDAIALKPVIAIKGPIRLAEDDKRLLLWRQREKRC